MPYIPRLLMLLIGVQIVEVICENKLCLTWNVEKDTLSLVCRLPNALTSMYVLINPHGQTQARCTYSTNGTNCSIGNEYGKVQFNSSKRQIRLDTIYYDGADGQWTCSDGLVNSTTVVNISSGILHSTNINLYGHYNPSKNNESIFLKCFSCRKPYVNGAEFLVNHRTLDNIRYSDVQEKCFHNKGDCQPGRCSCSPSGNWFTRVIQLSEIGDSKVFSCDMAFTDSLKNIRFSLYATIRLNGSDFLKDETKTIIRKSSNNNVYVTRKSNTALLYGILVSVIVLFLTSIIPLCYLTYKRMLRKKSNISDGIYQRGYVNVSNQDDAHIQQDDADIELTEIDGPATEKDRLIHHRDNQDISENCNERNNGWLLAAICFYDIATPLLGLHLQELVTPLYESLKKSDQIHMQTYNVHLDFIPPKEVVLNYGAINKNVLRFGKNKDEYDYAVKTALDFSKLFLSTSQSNCTYENFGEVKDPAILLRIINNIGKSPEPFMSTLEKIFSVQWKHWLHRDWDILKYESLIETTENFIYTVNLEKTVEGNLLSKLHRLRIYGIDILMDSEIYETTCDLYHFFKQLAVSNDPTDDEYDASTIKDEIDKFVKKGKEMKGKFRKLPEVDVNKIKVLTDISMKFDKNAADKMMDDDTGVQSTVWGKDLRKRKDDEICVDPIPQRTPLNDKMILNDHYSYTYAVDDWTRLCRFLFLSYTHSSLNYMIRLPAKSFGTNDVLFISDVSVNGRTVSQSPVIAALVQCTMSSDPKIVNLAFSRFLDICRTPRHLFLFINLYGVAGKGKRWGKPLRRALEAWYNQFEKCPMKLAYLVTKYKSGYRWTHKDVIRHAHIKPKTAELQLVFRYITHGIDDDLKASENGNIEKNPEKIHKLEENGAELSETFITKGFFEKEPNNEDDRQYTDGSNLEGTIECQTIKTFLVGVEKAKACREDNALLELIASHELSREHVPQHLLSSAAVWDVLGRNMPVNAFIRNLVKLANFQLLEQNSFYEAFALSKLDDIDLLKRARVHPLKILISWKFYSKGSMGKYLRVNRKRNKPITPLATSEMQWHVNVNVLKSLENAFFATFNLPVLSTGKNYCLAVDVGSYMRKSYIGGSIKTRDAVVAMMLLMVKTEQYYNVVAFSDKVERVNVTNKDTLDKAISKFSSFPFAHSNCSLPFEWAINNNEDFDVFVIYTNAATTVVETIHPSVAFRKYKRLLNKPDAMLIEVGIADNSFSIVDPDDQSMLRVAAFDTETPKLIAKFVCDNNKRLRLT